MNSEHAAPRFFVALANTDCIAYTADDSESRTKISITRLFPDSLRTNLLFSLSFDPTIHYETTFSIGSEEPETLGPSPANAMFADCGAFQYRDLETPTFSDGTLVTANSAWERYQYLHLGTIHHWDEILLCSPDHIVLPEHDEEEQIFRIEYTLSQAKEFIQLTGEDSRVTAVGVLHGNIDQRKNMLEQYIEMGFEYIALGGMVPLSTKPSEALNIVAGISDIENPIIAKDSILYRCREAGLKLHVLGLNSPEWWRWWVRLKIDSFDGSKLSTEGAANGWYWIAMDGKGQGRTRPENPISTNNLYRRIPVKKIGLTKEKWSKQPLCKPTHQQELIIDGVSTECSCAACLLLQSWKCASKKCKNASGKPHISDPRVMGSTEHNMGRVAHNAHVLEYITKEISRLNKLAETSDEDWLRNWKTVRSE